MVSDNGIHQGIQVGDRVYDNLNPNGINYDEWLDDLGYTGYEWNFRLIPDEID